MRAMSAPGWRWHSRAGCSSRCTSALQVFFIVPGAAAAAPRAGLAPRLGGGDHRGAGGRHGRLRAVRRDQHRPPPHRPAAARRWRGCRRFAEIGRHEGEAEARDRRGATQPLFRVGQSISGFPAGRRQPRPAARRLRRRDRRAWSPTSTRPRDHVHVALLHLARRHQRPEGGRGAEARRGARRDLPGDGRRPRLARHGPLDALEGHGGGRRPAGACAADRLPPWRGRSRAASTCATTARSW